LTRHFPKSLLLVKGRPIIDYIIDKLGRIKAVDEIIVVTNSKFFPEFRKWSAALACKKRISLVDDQTKDNAHRRGAIGDMKFSVDKKRIRQDLLVIGGDNLFSGDLKDFLSFSRDSFNASPVIGAYDIGSKAKAHNYGVLKLNASKQIVDFQEKPVRPASTLVAMCLYYFPKETLGLLKSYLRQKKAKNDAMGLYIDWLKDQVPVYGFTFRGSWYDIGDHKFYNAAKQTFAK